MNLYEVVNLLATFNTIDPDTRRFIIQAFNFEPTTIEAVDFIYNFREHAPQSFQSYLTKVLDKAEILD
jgi:hypothetical protein